MLGEANILKGIELETRHRLIPRIPAAVGQCAVPEMEYVALEEPDCAANRLPERLRPNFEVRKFGVVQAVTPNKVLSFEEAKERISEQVVTGKREQELQKYIEKLRTDAIIDWKNPELKKAYEEGLKQDATKAPAPVASRQ